MPTGYTQQIIDDTVKTPKEFLHLCLRNFGVCISMRDVPFDTPQDYTESIKKHYQDTMGYYTKALENAKKEYDRISNLSDDDLYEMYVKKFSDNRDYYQERTDKIKKQNAEYQSFYDAIKNWDCSEETSQKKQKITIQMSCLKRCSPRRNLLLMVSVSIRKISLRLLNQMLSITRRGWII